MSYLLEQAVNKLATTKEMIKEYEAKAPLRLASHGEEDRSYKHTVKTIAKMKASLKGLEADIETIKARNVILDEFKATL